MKVSQYVLLLFITLALSCARNKKIGLITSRVSRSDYIEKITVRGTVQAVVNFPVKPPNIDYMQMTVMRLAADGAFVKKGDTLCVLAAPELESMYQGARNSLDSLEAGLKKTEADNQLNIALLEAGLATNEAQLKISSLDSLRLKFATEVEQKLLQLEMKKALIEKEKTEKKLAATKLIGETDIRQMKARIVEKKSKVQSLADQVNSLTLTAQRDGIVMRTEAPVWKIMGPTGSGTIGGPIREGSVTFMDNPVLQFPDLDKMEISAEVAEADYKKLEKGQQAVLIVDAAEKLTTTGKINRKSLIGRNAERFSESNVKFYEVIIDIDSCHLKMKPGLSATCEITLTEVKDTLYVPTLAIFERDSNKVVYVLRKGHFIPVKVQTGFSGSSYTIIASGLEGGEIIALAEPPARLIANKTVKEERSDSGNINKPE